MLAAALRVRTDQTRSRAANRHAIVELCALGMVRGSTRRARSGAHAAAGGGARARVIETCALPSALRLRIDCSAPRLMLLAPERLLRVNYRCGFTVARTRHCCSVPSHGSFVFEVGARRVCNNAGWVWF